MGAFNLILLAEEGCCEHGAAGGTSRGFDVNMPAEDEAEEEAALSSSPNMFRRKGRRSDEDENRGRTRKRLRLSKEQFSFLEESFKDHNTLNPVSVQRKMR